MVRQILTVAPVVLSQRYRGAMAVGVLGVGLALVLGGWEAAAQSTTAEEAPPAVRQSAVRQSEIPQSSVLQAAVRLTAFRVRSGGEAPLNADRGWAGDLDEHATLAVDQPFRIRFELEATEDPDEARTFRLQCRRNDGEWANVQAEDFPVPRKATPQVSVVATPAYEHGAATTDLLPRSPAAFHQGAGVSLAAATPPWATRSGHSEWEWPVVIRRFADGAVTCEPEDRFEFRMVEAGGAVVDAAVWPMITAHVPAGLLGGTFVETPGRIGPWEASNGDLYFIMEPAETDNVLMVVKSSDRGATWREVDGTHRPAADDLEGVASALSNGTIHLLHQTSHAVWRHAFRTSDHPARPDTWDVRDELVATPQEPPTQVASIAVRSDGSLAGLYGGPAKVHLQVRLAGGRWGGETILDDDVPPNSSGPQCVVGADDVVHLAYTGSDGTAWYRTLQPEGALTPPLQLATGLGTTEYDVGSVLPLVYVAETNTVVVIYRLAEGHLWARQITADGTLSAPVQVTDRKVVQNAVDSDQTGADAIADGTTVHVMFIEEGTGAIYHVATDEHGDWQPASLQVDGINGQWIRGSLLTRGDDGPVLGYVYDAGSGGGSGMNRFATVPLPSR